MQAVTNIIQLRQLLSNRFPNVRMHLESPKEGVCWASGIRQLDGVLEGGLPKSALTELVAGNGGSALVIQSLLREAARQGQWAALVDGQDSFDPAAFRREQLDRLLWVRCENAMQAVKATDFLLRDGNLSLVILDLRMNPARQLQKIPASSWYRLQRCLEPIATAFLVVTPRPMVGAARTRLELQRAAVQAEKHTGRSGRGMNPEKGADRSVRLALAALSQPEEVLIAQLRFGLLRDHGMEQEQRERVAEAG